MVRKLMAVVGIAVLLALPLRALAAQEFKNHGQCVKTCVQDLGVEQNKTCSAMCKDGTYGQAAEQSGGGLPIGALCDMTNDLCAAPSTCQPLMPGWPVYYCW